ncbi:hypothetical protein CCP3SC15_130023 [Gammaproteobacteria bacterium]
MFFYEEEGPMLAPLASLLSRSILSFLCFLVLALPGIATASASASTSPPTVNKEQAANALAGLAIPFEENRGQSDPQVAFQAHTLAGPLFVTQDGALVWGLTPQHGKDFVGPPEPNWSLVEHFVNGKPKPVGESPSPTQISRFHGNDQKQWQTGVSTYGQVSLGEVWPGVQVRLNAHGKNAEKIFTLAPGVNADAIALEIAGGTLRLEDTGALQVESADRSLMSFTAPIAWQEIDGERRPVQVAYQTSGEHHDRYGFALGSHDASHPVFIDIHPPPGGSSWRVQR